MLKTHSAAATSNALIRDRAYINGEWVDGPDRLTIVNPATGDEVGTVPLLGEAAARDAVTAAAAAFGPWRARTAKERSDILKRWSALISANREELAAIITMEQGKPLAEARGEIGGGAAYIEWFAEEARRVYGDTIPGHMADKRIVVLRQPVGVVGAITPWNFPSSMIARKAAAALAVGCTMVVKPSELTPLSALALAALAEEAGIPAGVFNVVAGDAPAIGKVLTGDPKVRKFTFTGSTRVGKLLAAQCADTVKRVSLELGGNAPFIVFDDANLDAAVEGAMASKFRNSGQTCICANRLFVQDGIHDRFVEALEKRINSLVVGVGTDPATTQGPLINAAAVDKVAAHVADAKARGARLVTGGKRPENAGNGHFFAPTLMVDVAPDSDLCREETFGPLAGVVRFKTEAEVLAMANDTNAGLAAYVYTCDLGRTWRVGEGLEYGMVGLNTGLMTTEVSPFGGVKESGMGREGSRYGIDDYLDIKTLCIDVGT